MNIKENIQFSLFWHIAKGMKESEKTDLMMRLIGTLNGVEKQSLEAITFETLFLAILNRIHTWKNSKRVIVYGAGKMAKKHISEILRKNIEVIEIWDAYSCEDNIDGISIKRPYARNVGTDIPIIVFIDDVAVRKSIVSNLKRNGYEEFFYFRDYLRIVRDFQILEKIPYEVTDKTAELVSRLVSSYSVLDTGYAEIFFSIYKAENKDRFLKADRKPFNRKVVSSQILEKLTEKKIDGLDLNRALEILEQKTKGGCLMDIACGIEEALALILHKGAKTKERTLRMPGDKPYDSFAVEVTLRIILEELCPGNYECALEVIRFLQTISKENIILLSLESYFLIKNEEYESGLNATRKAMVIDSNDLLANESFYRAAVVCRQHGIYVEEPIPEYDLKERFCWSGISFAWCGGFDMERENADFGPCFRPLQCAARPDGQFWTSDDWKEFRRSITDGSFRYCQKNQCANIVAGWLPKKSHVKEEQLQKLIDGNMDIIPELSELHFSYDGHCNLMCPSCRTEYRTNTKELNEKYDELYDRELKPYVKKATHLCLSGCGEALISPHSRRILEFLLPEDYPNLEVELRTNMTVLNEKTWNELGEGRKSIRHIAASIDSCTKDNFEKIRFPAKWDNVYQNLKFVQNLRNAGEIDMFEFHVVIQKDNVEELLDIVKMAISLDADCVTFSRLINWRDMTEEEYHDVNPFWIDNPVHHILVEQWNEIMKLREEIENGTCALVKKKFYINLHFVPDPNDTYDEIREGRIRIR